MTGPQRIRRFANAEQLLESAIGDLLAAADDCTFMLASDHDALFGPALELGRNTLDRMLRGVRRELQKLAAIEVR